MSLTSPVRQVRGFNYTWDENYGFQNGITIKGTVNVIEKGVDSLFLFPTKYNKSRVIKLDKDKKVTKKPVLLFVSEKPLTNTNGKFTSSLDAYNSIVLFPYLSEGENEFMLTYVHPGEYYVTAVIDMDGDYYISKGDITNASKKIIVNPNSKLKVTIDNISFKNKLNLN